MPTISIIGGGLVGPFLAITLKKLGHDVLLFEKRANPLDCILDQGRSINLVLTSRGLNAFRHIGLTSEIIQISTPIQGRMIHPIDSNPFFTPYGIYETECNFSISRGSLNKLLIEQCLKNGVKVFFEHNLVDIDLASKKMIFEISGKKLIDYSYNQLFDASGVFSKIRTNLINFINQESDLSAHEEIHDAFTCYKELVLPAAPNNSYLIDKKALHIWPRDQFMLMALANNDGSFTLTFYWNKNDLIFSDPTSATQLKSLFIKNFPNLMLLCPSLVDHFYSTPIGSLVYVNTTPWYYKDEVCLIGDSAHAITPFFGQGLNIGLEDCFMIAQLITQKIPAKNLFQRFFEIQKENADAVSIMANENFQEMQAKVKDEQFKLFKAVEEKLERKFPQIFRSRYSMVTYSLIPYAKVLQLGEIERKIVQTIISKLNLSLSNLEIDYNVAQQIIELHLAPYLKSFKLSLDFNYVSLYT